MLRLAMMRYFFCIFLALTTFNTAHAAKDFNFGMAVGLSGTPEGHSVLSLTGILSKRLSPRIRSGSSLTFGTNFSQTYLVDIGGFTYFYATPDFFLGPALDLGKVFGPNGYSFPYAFAGVHFGTYLGNSEIFWEPGILYPLTNGHKSEMQWLRIGASISF